MVAYRTFHNSDPPRILKLWHTARLGPGAAEGFPCDVLEMAVFSQPFFDPHGFIIAETDGQVCGFVHAGFAPNAEGTALDHTQGTISGLVVHPQHRRRGIGSQLVRRAEDYLRQRNAKSVVAGAGLDKNGFYNGIYGGVQCSGFSAIAAPWHDFFGSLNYQPDQTTKVLHRDLSTGRDPISSQIMRNRRRLNLVVTDRMGSLNWWWHVRFGKWDSLNFELRERHSDQVVATAQIVGLDIYIPKWQVLAVGLQGLVVPESHRRCGYGLSMVLEVCRHLRERSIQLIEVHVDENNVAGLQLFERCSFQPVTDLLTFRREL